jgi:hypothetical protein
LETALPRSIQTLLYALTHLVRHGDLNSEVVLCRDGKRSAMLLCMAEDPIKLFASRAERYPQPTEVDTAQAVARVGIAAIPAIGGSINEFLSLVLAPAVARRRDEWFKELADDFDQMEKKVEGFKVEKLIDNEAFVSATIQATVIAIRTHQHEKREYLRNALLNIAKGMTPDEIKQQFFLNAIEAFTPTHIRALNVIWRGASLKVNWDYNSIPIPQRTYGAAIGISAPEVKGQTSLIVAFLADLRNRGFSNLSGPDLAFPQGSAITNFGIEFLNFVLSPEDLLR